MNAKQNSRQYHTDKIALSMLSYNTITIDKVNNNSAYLLICDLIISLRSHSIMISFRPELFLFAFV